VLLLTSISVLWGSHTFTRLAHSSYW